jgi:(p)ppGpp synthase/HD superfamily hydrolase
MKKTDALSLEKTVEFAKRYYADKKTISGLTLIEHCMRVSRQAEIIAQKLYQDVRKDLFVSDSAKDSVMALVHGALLHDVLHVSDCAFENIAEATTVQIAAMVADVTRDFRLVETKRDMEFRGRLSQSPVTSQILVVADVVCTAKEVLAVLKDQGKVIVPRAKKILTQMDGDLLAIHAASRYYMLRLYVHAARNLLQEISQKIKECKQRARAERHAAVSLQKLKERIAEKHEKQPTAKNPAKPKKEKRYARKRAAETDSE